MAELLKDLLVYSRVVHPEQELAWAADLNKSLAEALLVLKGRIDEGNVTLLSGQLDVVCGDERQLSLVFQNLISNAVKYRSTGAVRIEISCVDSPNGCTVSVKDNGIGFDSTQAERIFGLFKRLHSVAYPGTGLGLAICKRIIERYEGRIWAHSEGEGRGATFSFFLPKPKP